MNNLFKKKDIIKNLNTNNICIVMEVPAHHKTLKYNDETYYKCMTLDMIFVDNKPVQKTFIRCKSEMEDGRYVISTEVPTK